MSVRAKFKVNEITMRRHWTEGKGTLYTIKLTPVMGGSEENKKFYEASPAGQIELGTLNTDAGEQFELGGEYYVDFTKASTAAE
jgi:hypothetical protein